MRVLPMIMLTALLGVSAVRTAQSQNDNWSECKGKDPDQIIEGCSALIQSGEEVNDSVIANVYYRRGWAYRQKGNYELAIQDYDQALRHSPNDAEAFYGRGLAYEQKGDYDRAIQDNDQALRINPSYADAYIVRGNAFLRRMNTTVRSQTLIRRFC